MGLYAKDREKLDQKPWSAAKHNRKTVVHICLFNSKGEVLVQRIKRLRMFWSNMRDALVGGSVIAGETDDVAVKRELFEDLGIDISFEKLCDSLIVNFEGGFYDF